MNYPIGGLSAAAGDINISNNTRIGSITEDYIGPDGMKYENTSIVNETNNTFYNPVTGDTYNISEWNYDYSTRTYNITTYNITTDNSQTYNITYGDEHVTINQGDTITNIYYGGGSGTTDPPIDPPTDPEVCKHQYTSLTTQEPTCAAPGQTKNTCTLCAKTFPEVIPAKGHTWAVERTVQTTYDDSGALLQKGYTIYKCSVCNEQYKDENGTGPPGPPSDSGSEGGKESIWDKVGGLLGSIGNIFITIVEATIASCWMASSPWWIW